MSQPSSIRVAYKGHCYGPFLAPCSTTSHILQALGLTSHEMHNQQLQLHKIGEPKPITIGLDESLRPGVYELVPNRSLFQPFEKRRAENDDMNSKSTEAVVELIRFELDEVYHMIHPFLHLDASKRTQSKLNILKKALEKLHYLNRIVPDTQRDLQHRIACLWTQIMCAVQPSYRRPKDLGPSHHYHHVSDFKTLEMQTQSEHWTNLAHLQRRIHDQSAAKEVLKSNVRDYALNPTYRFKRGQPILDQSPFLDEIVPEESVEEVPSRDDYVDTLVSAMRIKVLDTMLRNNVYRSRDVKQIISELLQLESDKFQGTSRCHGRQRLFPTDQVACQLYQAFNIN